MAPLTLARSWSALGLYRPQFPHLKHGLKTSPSAGQGLLESMSPERCVQEPKGSDTLSQTTLPHQGPLSLLSTPMGLGGGTGSGQAGPVKGPQQYLPHSSPHHGSSPPPVSPTRKVAASPWRLRLRLQQPWGPQTLPKVGQGWEDGPSMECQGTSRAGPTPPPGREMPLITPPSSHPQL